MSGSHVVGKTKGAKVKADRLFSLIIRSAGRCENCGSTAYLHTAHIISRRYSNTRCDLDNAFCACAKCHHYWTEHPPDFGRFVFEQIGEDGYDDLVRKSRLTTKVDWDAEVARLTPIWKEIESRV